MLGKEIAIRYAQALFASALERGYLDAADEQLGALQAVFEKDRTLVNYLTAPQVTDANKRAVINKIFDDRFARGVREFMLTVTRKRREAYIPEIIEMFRELVADHRGMLKPVVTVAHRLNDQQRAALAAKLAAKTGKKIELIERLDSRLIGGAHVRIKDQALDGSVSNALQELRETLEAIEV
ncbi:MAG TPA: ATP synthase F1 subunit delta [candidate division Zixibacteria bacterium]|nr:ATP synthase F1 subunit delta [candidate division Zixibacteria bacterium]